MSKIGFLLSLYFFGFAFETGVILGLGTLLFALNPEGLYLVVAAANSFLTILAAFGVYVAYYIFHPRLSPWPAIFAVFLLGILIVTLTVASHPKPFITPARGIDWNVQFPLSLVTFYLLLIGIGGQLYIFVNLFFRAISREIKILSLILAVMALGGIADAFLRFVALHTVAADVRTRIYDFLHGFIGLGFILTIIIASFMRKLTTPKDEKII